MKSKEEIGNNISDSVVLVLFVFGIIWVVGIVKEYYKEEYDPSTLQLEKDLVAELCEVVRETGMIIPKMDNHNSLKVANSAAVSLRKVIGNRSRESRAYKFKDSLDSRISDALIGYHAGYNKSAEAFIKLLDMRPMNIKKIHDQALKHDALSLSYRFTLESKISCD